MMGGEGPPIDGIELRSRTAERAGWLFAYSIIPLFLIVPVIVWTLTAGVNLTVLIVSVVILLFIGSYTFIFFLVVKYNSTPISIDIYTDRYRFNYPWNWIKSPDVVEFKDIVFFRPYDQIVDISGRKFHISGIDTWKMVTLEAYLKRSAAGFGLSGDLDDINAARLVQKMETPPHWDRTFTSRSVLMSIMYILAGLTIIALIFFMVYLLTDPYDEYPRWKECLLMGFILFCALAAPLFLVMSVSGFFRKTLKVDPVGITYHSGKRLKFHCEWVNMKAISTIPGSRYSTASIHFMAKDGRSLDLSGNEMDPNVLTRAFQYIKDYAWFHRIELRNSAGW